MSDERLDHHGHSPAAWTGVITMMIGFAIITVALFIDWQLGVMVGGILILAGVPLGAIIKLMGYGINGPKYDPFNKAK